MFFIVYTKIIIIRKKLLILTIIIIITIIIINLKINALKIVIKKYLQKYKNEGPSWLYISSTL